MKIFKLSGVLVLLLILIVSCEEDSNPTVESNSSKNFEGFESKAMHITEIENSKNIQFSKVPKAQFNRPEYNENIMFFNDSEEFYNNCNPIMQTETFENAHVPIGWWYGWVQYFDENTDHGDNQYAIFLPGDLQPNVGFVTLNENNDVIFTAVFNSWDFTGNYGNKILAALDYNEEGNIRLEIDFKNNTTYDVNFQLYPNNYSDLTIEIYGDNGLIGTSNVYEVYGGSFWGAHSKQNITKLILKSTNNVWALGVDNLNFGYCDSDDDSVPNAIDAFPFSNINEYLYISETNTRIKNLFTKNAGTTMADEMENLIQEINSQYNGENYNQLHKKFVSEVAKLSYYWYKSRLITSKERSKISSFAWSSNVPSFQQPG